jgi:hypothetical protein
MLVRLDRFECLGTYSEEAIHHHVAGEEGAHICRANLAKYQAEDLDDGIIGRGRSENVYEGRRARETCAIRDTLVKALVGAKEDGKSRVLEALVIGAVVDSAPTVHGNIVIGLTECRSRDQHR